MISKDKTPRKRKAYIDDDGEFIGLTDQDLDREPDLTWRVDHVLPDGGLAMLFGTYGTAKTFLALDLAHTISTGGSWCDYAVCQGPVVYVAAEGSQDPDRSAHSHKPTRRSDVRPASNVGSAAIVQRQRASN